MPDGLNRYAGLTPACREALLQIAREAARGRTIYGEFNSLHEAYAVILEEVEELWAEIKHDPDVDLTRVHEEAMQIAALASRVMMEFHPGETEYELAQPRIKGAERRKEK